MALTEEYKPATGKGNRHQELAPQPTPGHPATYTAPGTPPAPHPAPGIRHPTPPPGIRHPAPGTRHLRPAATGIRHRQASGTGNRHPASGTGTRASGTGNRHPATGTGNRHRQKKYILRGRGRSLTQFITFLMCRDAAEVPRRSMVCPPMRREWTS